MEDKESTESGSPGINSEAESPPVSGSGGGGGGGVVVPELINMAVNMSMERSLGVLPLPVPAAAAATTGGFASEGLVAATSGGGDLSGKKKRGRPRKYDSEGNLRVPYIASTSPHPPQAIIEPPPGFTLTTPNSSGFSSSSKRGRGRPPGSGSWQLLASLGELFADTAGGDFTPHVVNVGTGEDVAAKILAFAQKGPRGICVLSANGAVSNVTIRQPGSSGGLLTYEGRFEILRLTGSFTIAENSGIKSRTGGLSVSLASPDGRVIGGGIAGLLVAASPIQMVVGSFVPHGYKTHKRKHVQEYQMAPIIQGAPDTVTAAKPISQAAPDRSFCLNQASQFPVQSHGEVDNSANNKDNLNSMPTNSTNLSGSDPTSEQRVSPDINVSVPAEQL